MNFSNANAKQLLSLSRDQVLNLPDRKKLAYFDVVRVRHGRINDVMDDMASLLFPENDSDLILLIGPTGVGKSTLAHSLIDKTIQEMMSEIDSNRSCIPIVRVEAPSNGERSMSWRALYQDILGQLEEPLIDKKVVDELSDGRRSIRYSTGGSTIAALRKSVERALVNRGTRVLVIDEAIHLLRQGAVPVVMDTIKSLANTSNAKIVLLGSYDLFDLLCLNGQVARRSILVPFNRYLSGNKEDEHAFFLTIRSLEKYWPYEDSPNLWDHRHALMQASLGCVGILKGTLKRALAITAKHGGKWDPNTLKKAALSKHQLSSILKEIQEGDRLIEEALSSSM